ncbi:hypothetical protein [Aquirufa sp.]|jgi:hypothetical protein|uniref:hypothetical protein n=1 Tax=Aquirufa sp. TaxID=2676249 RepID=UPI003784F0FE
MAKLNKPRWVVQMDWLDKETYWGLSDSERKDVNTFQNLSKAINHHHKVIEENDKLLKQLQKDNAKRLDKIRLNQLKASPIFRKIEYLKAEHEIDVYYMETLRKNKVRNKEENRHLHKEFIIAEYPKCYIKYRTKNLANTKTIILKSQRFENLKLLKEVCPKWYRSIGESLNGEELNSNKLKIAMVELTKPVIKRILANQFKEIAEGRVILNFDLLLKEMAKMKL